MRALPLSIFEDKRIGNCSNNGISSRYNQVLLIHEEGHVVIDEENPPENLVRLVKCKMFGKEYMHLEPYKPVQSGCVGYMMGGTYASSCDSRFWRISNYPLPIHDRQETQEMYNKMSN